MPEKWTGDLIGRMHNAKVTYEDIANELGVTKAYVSMILNSSRKPKEIEARMEQAFTKVIEKRRNRLNECD